LNQNIRGNRYAMRSWHAEARSTAGVSDRCRNGSSAGAARNLGQPTIAEALRRATLALIDKGKPAEAHPAYWAPFIVVGENGC
jgi:hypothetical protein